MKLILDDGIKPETVYRRIEDNIFKSFNTKNALKKIEDKISELMGRICYLLELPYSTQQITIKIFKTKDDLWDFYNKTFQDNKSYKAFYVNTLNTIYTSAETISYTILAHEITHAIVDNYFTVLPTKPIRECIAQFVEKNI